MRFLADEGYTHYLSKNDQPEQEFILLTPLRVSRNLKQPEEGFDTLLTNSQLARIANNLNNEQIVIALDTEILVKYTDELMKAADSKNEAQA